MEVGATARTITDELTWAKEQLMKRALGASIGAELSMLAASCGRFEIHPDGTETFIVNGKPLLKLGPVQFKTTTGEEGKTTMRITREYETVIQEAGNDD